MIKLSDYGYPSHMEYMSDEESALYMSPESSIGMVEMKSDVWSLGASLIEMALGESTCFQYSIEELHNKLTERPLSINVEKASTFQDFVKKCMAKNLSGRSSVADLMKVRAIGMTEI